MSFSSIAQLPEAFGADVKSFLDKKYAALIKKPNQKGISGWVFDIPTGETLTHSSEQSQHYSEAGLSVNDTIIHKPDQITLTGFIGELVYRVPQPGSVEYALQQAQNRLAAVNAYLGPFTQGATQKAATAVSQASYVANQVNAIAKRASNMVKYFSGDDAAATAQQKAYIELYALWWTKQVVEVQTPWMLFPRMQITNITVRQDDVMNDYTDFSVTLSEYRAVEVKTTNFDENLFPPATDMQSAETMEQGKQTGAQTSSDSWLYSAGSSFGVFPK